MPKRKILQTLRTLVATKKEIVLSLDAEIKGGRAEGVDFVGYLIYQSTPSAPGRKDEGYYFVPVDLEKKIRLFVRELGCKEIVFTTFLISSQKRETRGSGNSGVKGREERYGLFPEYAQPRKYFPLRSRS